MYKVILVVLGLSVMSSYAADKQDLNVIQAYNAITNPKRDYPSWIENAAKVYIKSKKGVLMDEVAINNGTTVYDINSHLIDEGICTAGRVFRLSPVHKYWYDLGYFDTNDGTELKSGRIKDHMQKYNTNTFWINFPPRKQSTTDEEEDN